MLEDNANFELIISEKSRDNEVLTKKLRTYERSV